MAWYVVETSPLVEIERKLDGGTCVTKFSRVERPTKQTKRLEGPQKENIKSKKTKYMINPI